MPKVSVKFSKGSSKGHVRMDDLVSGKAYAYKVAGWAWLKKYVKNYSATAGNRPTLVVRVLVWGLDGKQRPELAQEFTPNSLAAANSYAKKLVQDGVALMTGVEGRFSQPYGRYAGGVIAADFGTYEAVSMTESKKRKLTGRDVVALRAAAKHGIVAGGMDASFAVHHKLWKNGLIAHTGPGADTITDRGMQALKDGFYTVESVIDMREAKNLSPEIEKKIDKIEADIKAGKISDKEGRKKIGDLMQSVSKAEAIIEAALAGEPVSEIIEKISAYDPRWGNPYPYAPVVRPTSPIHTNSDYYNYPLHNTQSFPRGGHETHYADGHEAEANEYMSTGDKR